MATKPDQQQSNEPKSLLIAHLRAHLASGESFELLPIQHEQDVKTEVESLVESWSKSGFLIHGRFLYPWHQVKYIEVTQVDELPPEMAHEGFDERHAAERARTQDDFWHTRHKTEKSEEQDAGSPGPQ